MRRSLVAVACAVACSLAVCARAEEIANREVVIDAVKDGDAWVGFDVRDRRGASIAVVRLSSDRRIRARGCLALQDSGGRKALVFSGLVGATGVELGAGDTIEVALENDLRFPRIRFDLTIAGFDAAAWTAEVGREPFHFLSLHLPEAEAWHQRGWLNATPLADRFPLLEDTHVGTPEISAYKFDRRWSYTPPLGAHPLPVIGLWAPKSKRYVGLEFQSTRLAENTEKEVATGYRWVEPRPGSPEDAAQFVALVWPYGGRGYQDLVLPKVGDRIASGCRLLWSLDLPATSDPNRFFWEAVPEAMGDPRTLAGLSPVADVSWIPGGIRLRDFQGPDSTFRSPSRSST